MIVKLLTEHHLEFLSLKGGCRGLSESTLVKIPHCRKSQASSHFITSGLGDVATTNHRPTNYTVRKRNHQQLSSEPSKAKSLSGNRHSRKSNPPINRGSYMSAHILLNLLNEFSIDVSLILHLFAI